MKYTIKIEGENYEVLDALNNITLADSFVRNKLGSGHGEAKLYVGNENARFFEFFDDLNRECFFVKSDFDRYLGEAESEFLFPQQSYVNKSSMPQVYESLLAKLKVCKEGLLKFRIYRVNVNPPRVYLNSESMYYDLMRSLGLPNISYLSVLKLKGSLGEMFYYFRMFIDYQSDIVKYDSPIVRKEREKIEQSTLSVKKKEMLYQARVGQGEYRKKLLEDCLYCPFTMVNDERLLIASHIKPWAVCDDKEKIDPKNGFVLTPTYDKLFDSGFVTFHDDKTIEVSPWISPMNQKRLSIYTGMKVPKLQLDAERCTYLIYHRAHIYKG